MAETAKFYFVGNNLGIDLANTKVAANGKQIELLEQFSDLAAWALSAGLISKEEADDLIENWKEIGPSTLRDALRFRAVIHELIVGLASGASVDDKALDAINDQLKLNNGNTEIMRSETGFEKVHRADYRDPEQILTAVAESVADLLAYGDLSLIRKCENPDCVLFFYDTTKNHKRRWCSMAACGNRAKARAFYQRSKGTKDVAGQV